MDGNMAAKFRFKLLAIGGLLLLSCFFIFTEIDFDRYSIFSNTIKTRAEEYVDSSFEKAVVGFSVVSIVKAAISIVEGSTIGASVGVSAEIEAGDVVQPVYDFVDIAWRVILWSCTILLSIKIVFKATGVIDNIILGISLFLFAGFLITKWYLPSFLKFRKMLQDFFSLSILLFISIYYIIPFSVFLSSKMSEIVTRPYIEEAYSGFEETKKEISMSDETNKENGFFQSLKNTYTYIVELPQKIKENTKSLFIWSIKLIVGYLFDCIIFPLMIFLLLFWTVGFFIKYFFNLDREITLIKTLEKLIVSKEKID